MSDPITVTTGIHAVSQAVSSLTASPGVNDLLSPAREKAKPLLARTVEIVLSFGNSLLAPLERHTISQDALTSRHRNTEEGRTRSHASGVTADVQVSEITARVMGSAVIQEILDTVERDTPEGRICSPSLHIAGPALEAMRFATDEPDLRSLYVNLIAASMDTERVRRAHPAFVEIIKQLTPDEARIIASIGHNRNHFLLELITLGDPGQEEYTSDLVIRLDAPQYWSAYIENLHRLGIIASTSDQNDVEYLSDHSTTEELEAYARQKNREMGRDEDAPMVLRRQRIHIKEFGRIFCSACTR